MFFEAADLKPRARRRWQDRYAEIFRLVSGAPAWQARHGLTSAQYQAAFDQFVAQGYRLELVNGYSVAGQDRFAAIWTK